MTLLPGALPLYPLLDGPTPLQEMPRLRDALLTEVPNCPRLFVKRDDLTGLAGGGNKTRKLQYLIADALQQGADTVITAGALQSNHVRQTAAAAAKAGLRAHAILFDMVDYPEPAYHTSGNILLDRILGATLHRPAKGANARDVFDEVMQQVEAEGGTPYMVPVGGSNAVGSTAYAEVFLEITAQCETQGVTPTRITHATGSLGTQAGLLAGRALSGLELPIQAVSVARPDREALAGELLEIANQTATRIGAADVLDRDIHVDFRHVGDGYGLPTSAMVSAVELVARTEGILLDPVYSGKGMAGLIAQILNGEIDADETVIFLHTGGMPGLFAYSEMFQ
ncbi:MAG: D-cysteine desulfhydrase family protein [Alphaproteobacteria bacterium]|nr:D-cysteine desulfhydrase family protein [Alphaproteobacteria bacterium]MBO6628862.1 D-cysteine desulfhydrase family protein [Alphaproteobacteria bacterium]MDF1625937.1 D-cysteine desulfhydrase family protein [Parvibaculaceae bacterium]